MKCFYHSADLDGHCSGAIIKREFPRCEIIGINYGDEFPWDKIQPNEKIFMVDFSLQPFDGMERLNNICMLHWIDHHKTAIDEAHKRSFLAYQQHIENGLAGCELTWEYIYGKSCTTPLGVRLLGRYDVWDNSDSRTLPFQYGMRNFANTFPDNIELWEKIFSSDSFCETIIEQGELLLEYERKQNEKFCKAYSFETVFDGMKAICANRGFCNSKLFDSVYDPSRHHLMISFVRMKYPKKLWTVSLYSTREDVDCGAIAKKYGGGGHNGAAGFQTKEIPFPM